MSVARIKKRISNLFYRKTDPRTTDKLCILLIFVRQHFVGLGCAVMFNDDKFRRVYVVMLEARKFDLPCKRGEIVNS